MATRALRGQQRKWPAATATATSQPDVHPDLVRFLERRGSATDGEIRRKIHRELEEPIGRNDKDRKKSSETKRTPIDAKEPAYTYEATEFEALAKDLKFLALSKDPASEGFLRDLMAPFHEYSYGRQLELKTKKHSDVLRRLESALKFREHSFIPLGILPSREKKGYGHITEFNIHQGRVGFIVKSRKTGITECLGPSQDLDLFCPPHRGVAEDFQAFLDKYPVDLGPSAKLVVKSNLELDLLVNLYLDDAFKDGPMPDGFKNDLKRFFETESSVKLKSLYIQSGTVKQKVEPIHLSGIRHLKHNFHDVKFLIGPETVSPSNLSTTPRILKAIVKLLNPCSKTVILDLHCGSGLQCLHLAREVRGCVGIDANMLCAKEAAENARLNGFKNCQFTTGTLEDDLPDLLYKLSLDPVQKVSVIMNPRLSVRKSVITALKRAKKINKILYICSNPERDAFNNFYDLIQHTKVKHNKVYQLRKEVSTQEILTPFRLVKSLPIDTHPMTVTCGHMFLFGR